MVHGFKDEHNNERAISGAIYGANPETFIISKNGTTKELHKGDQVVISRSFTTFNSGCTVSNPCSLVILSQNGPGNSQSQNIQGKFTLFKNKIRGLCLMK